MTKQRAALMMILLALMAGPIVSQEIGTRSVNGGTHVEVYFQAVDPSPRCTAILELQDALNDWRDRQDDVLVGALTLSADTYTRQSGGLCEFAIRVATADGPAAFVSTWAQRCATSGQGGTQAEQVAYCLAERLRDRLRQYRERAVPSVDPGALADPPS